MSSTLDRRRLLQGAFGLGSAGLVSGCATAAAPRLAAPAAGPIRIAPIRAAAHRIIDVTVCTRPFRAAGPRLDVETIGGGKIVVHNYGHGGSGWSLSWGSGTVAVGKAMATNPGAVAVVGCGALGLTAAILAQEAGAEVTIYARDLVGDTRSMRATGIWSPDSRIALAGSVDAGFPALWEAMARTSWRTFRRYLGLPGAPVAFVDNYTVDGGAPAATPASSGEALAFARYRQRIRDVTPGTELLPAGATTFPAGMRVRRQPALVFNLASYADGLMTRFRAGGGQVRRMDFRAPADLAALPEPVVINCPGYGARTLWRDESVVPVRGQLAWLVPQPEVDYALSYHDVGVVARSDGIAVQDNAGGDMRGYGDAGETVDRAGAEGAVATIAGLFARMG